jgi:hypothetical protein
MSTFDERTKPNTAAPHRLAQQQQRRHLALTATTRLSWSGCALSLSSTALWAIPARPHDRRRECE